MVLFYWLLNSMKTKKKGTNSLLRGLPSPLVWDSSHPFEDFAPYYSKSYHLHNWPRSSWFILKHRCIVKLVQHSSLFSSLYFFVEELWVLRPIALLALQASLLN